jgi:hypothetical protein
MDQDVEWAKSRMAVNATFTWVEYWIREPHDQIHECLMDLVFESNEPVLYCYRPEAVEYKSVMQSMYGFGKRLHSGRD